MKHGLAVIGFLATLSLAGCGGDKADSDSNQPGTVSADGWEKIEMEGTLRGALIRTEMDVYGAFKTSWNPCHQEQFGSLKDGAAWVKIVNSVNAAIRATPILEEEVCFESTESAGHRLDEVIVTTYPDKRKITLFTDRGYRDICTQVPDQNLIRELETGLLQLAKEAASEGCYRE